MREHAEAVASHAFNGNIAPFIVREFGLFVWEQAYTTVPTKAFPETVATCCVFV